MDYRTIGPLCAYIDRIGAQQLNFRTFMVREYHGAYYFEKCLIRLKPDGDVECREDRYAPTDEERVAIKAALQGVSIPAYVQADYAKLRQLKEMIAARSPVLYEFFNRANDKLIMVQERVTQRDGGKKYFPWTYWSDGVWRQMEPDEALPLWKPRHSTNKAKIMVHEGAKAAHFIHEMLHAPAMAERKRAHPWADELLEFEHWGMIGGALAPHRTDWKSLRDVKPLEIVYVCDNDFPGKRAAQGVSRHLQYSLKVVMFDQFFGLSFDMADTMPAALFDDLGRWIGPTVAALMQPATWATTKVSTENNPKKLRTVIRPEFCEEWFHSVTPEAFIHKHWPNRILNMKEFNNLVQPYADTEDVARLLKGDTANKTVVLKYDPSNKSGVYGHDAGRCINTHKGTVIKSAAGDVTPFLEFMGHLVQDQIDLTELLRWCATLIARPEIKMMYGVLLISETQGVGKGTLGEKILGPLVGMHNVSFPSEAEIVDSNFNYWTSHKRLAIVHEIYAGHSAKAYNKLKSLITDHHITVSQKYMANYFIDNWIHIFACSNSMRALKLSMDDRRWFVPKVTDDKQTPGYWDNFNRWLTHRGGLSFIKKWAEDWLEENAPVSRGAAAPWSSFKKEVIEEAYSEGQMWVDRFLEQCKNRMNGHAVVLTDIGLRNGIRQFVHEGRQSNYLESPHTIRKLAKSKGWFVGENFVRFSALGTENARTKIIASTRQLANAASAEDLGDVQPLDVVAKAREWQRI